VSVRAVRRDPDVAAEYSIVRNANDAGVKPGHFVCVDGTPLFMCDTFAEAKRAKRFLEMVPVFAVDV
jgi:hypothetical protein